MPSTVAVHDLKIGMFVHLDLGWMSHPFPLSSFRIASADQIVTIRQLGLERVTWLPEKSTLEDIDTPTQAQAAAPAAGTETAIAAAETAAEARRQQLRRERAAQRHCEAQFEEASDALHHINSLLGHDPAAAAGHATILARAILDKMLGASELYVRLLSVQGGDRLASHALNVTVISMLMGRSMGLSADDMLELGTGALLHDIGKLDLPPRVHHVDDGFSSAEHKAYRDHVILGVARGRKMHLPVGVLQVLAQHHELADGSGFPHKLSLDRMSLPARLVALVNRYDNLCNPGPRGVALTPHEALSILFAQSRSKFDLPVLNGFIRMMGVYPAGSVVQLTDERFALVTQVNTSRPLKPRVLVHDARVPRDEALMLDLEREPDIGIRRSLSPDKLPAAAALYLTPRVRITYYFDSLSAPRETADGSPAEIS